MFPLILVKPAAECTPEDTKKQAAAWDVVVKVAAHRAAELGVGPTEEDMPIFVDMLAQSLNEHAEKTAAERARPGIYTQFYAKAAAETPVGQRDFERDAQALVAHPAYADLFN